MTPQRAEIDTLNDGAFVRASARRIRPGWEGLRPLDGAILLVRMSNLLAESAPRLTLREVLAVACDMMASHLQLTGAVLFQRVAGQSRTFGWSARTSNPGVPQGALGSTAERSASVSLANAQLGLFAKLSVESHRRLDASDREFLQEVLRQILGVRAAQPDTGSPQSGSRAVAAVVEEVFADEPGHQRHDDEREDPHDRRLQVRGSKPAVR
jgi:hypothetical protein